MSRHWRLGSGLVLLILATIAYIHGCGETGQTRWLKGRQDHAKSAENATIDDDANQPSAGIRDTVQTVAYIEGLRRMAVGGYGLVVGLGKNGTAQCPRPVRDYLLKEMRTRYRLGSEYEELKHLAPEKLVDSEETAPVTVYGEISAAARKGATFDLTVRAIDGTDTRSLDGGWLMPCSLKLWANGEPVEGRILGEACGQIFINPFGLKEKAATKADPRTGIVIGGAKSNEARRIRLVLIEPSAAIASRLMYLINQRFGVEPEKTADALSPHVVDLHVPPKWEGREAHFLELMLHLYVPAAPSFGDIRLRELSEEVVKPGAAYEDIALAWEGFGKICLPSVRKLYTHADFSVSYYAARTGLRLGDDLALDVMARHLKEAKSPFHVVIVRELGEATDLSRATLILRPILDHEDQRLRQLAIESITKHKDPIIKSTHVGEKASFLLNTVPTSSKYLISASRMDEQRISLLGSGMKCQTPAFYSHHSDLIVLSANAGAKELTLMRRTPLTGRMSPPIKAPLDVTGLVRVLGGNPMPDGQGQYHGLGLNYSQVVEVLHDLCANKTIDATFVLQNVEALDALAAPPDAGRPESEL